MFLLLPEGLPWRIFSDWKAQSQICLCCASLLDEPEVASADVDISTLLPVEPDFLRHWRAWMKAADKATEKAAELPSPAPIGTLDVTLISIGSKPKIKQVC